MVKIRLRRMGAKKNPYYRIVVADSKSPRDGRCIEEIGTYNPLTSPSEISVDIARAQYWIKNGAQPTDTVRVLLKKAEAQVSAASGASISASPEASAVETPEEPAGESSEGSADESPEEETDK